ncbi:DUF4959 domain-containing protein [Sphingobacterium sp. SGG-5]|uniref:DUF5000 domain-containing lipoprotein n=1 Tax=Sphingobacterium sp. SGG-5 TaxID=2710881 RepID=UPI0013ECB9C7|nr:DUF5000 domain-containing lipoprotein [Sphingobacterium sp. SGG-5]NGM60759.1 DUF4959 domain-containing protein [Sphingobacterium sp. SGG-5]
MKKKIMYLILPFLIWGCGEDYIGQYALDDIPPGPVSGVSVENIPGGSVISYIVPTDEDFSYVKAVYKVNGQTKEQKSSVFNRKITLEGFGKSVAQQIELIAYDKSENASTPVKVDIQPLDAPVFDMIEGVTIKDDFGGIRVDWQNPHKSDVVLTVLTTTDQYGEEEWTEADRFYSSAVAGGANVRGYNDEERFFGLYFRDRWDNFSDTLYIKAKPFFEEQLDKSKFSRWNPSGIPYNAYNTVDWKIENLWNNVISGGGAGFASYTHDNTFNMGQMAKLSRIRINNRPEETTLYNFAHPKKFQIWGSNHPNVNADFSTWTLLGEFDSFKPSGLPLGEFNDDDYNYGHVNGEEWNFPLDIPPVQYIRWYVIDTWGGSEYTQVMEMTLWGEVQK